MVNPVDSSIACNTDWPLNCALAVLRSADRDPAAAAVRWRLREAVRPLVAADARLRRRAHQPRGLALVQRRRRRRKVGFQKRHRKSNICLFCTKKSLKFPVSLSVKHNSNIRTDSDLKDSQPKVTASGQLLWLGLTQALILLNGKFS